MSDANVPRVVRVTVPLGESEAAALFGLAKRELRDPRYQAALLIRDRLVELGELQAGQVKGLLRDESIDTLNMKIIYRNRFMNCGINTVGALADYVDDPQRKQYRNFGRGTLEAARAALSSAKYARTEYKKA